MSLKRRDSMNQNSGGGGGLRVAADDPHLVSLGGGRLSTAVTIHQLPIGESTIGSSVECSVVLCGSGVQPVHCTLLRAESGIVTLYANSPDCRILLDGRKIADPCGGCTLSQGVMITIGKSNYLRFNHPAEAEQLRSTIGSNERISMPQIDFAQDSTSSGGSSTDGSPCENMMHSSGLATDSALDGVMNKIAKDDLFLQNMNNYHVSPKVFTSETVTANAPARDVLGARFNNFTKNLTQMFGKNDKNSHAAANQAQRKMNNTAAGELRKSQNTHSLPIPDNAHAQAIVQSPKIQQSSACYDRYPKPGSYGSLQVFPMNNLNSEMNTTDAGQSAPQAPVALTGPTELQRQRAQLERMQEEEHSKMEYDRLEEILKMCADFERQNESSSLGVQSSPIVQNRIKTNGSLPREKKSTSLDSASSGSSKMTRSAYENVMMDGGQSSSSATTSPLDVPDGGKKPMYVPQSPRTKIKTCVSPKRDVTFGSSSKRAEYDALVQSFEEKLRLEIQLIRDHRLTTSTNNATNAPAAGPEPVYGTLEKRNKNVNNLKVVIGNSTTDEDQLKTLNADRSQLLQKIRLARTRLSHLQKQDDELTRELDLEKALVSAELVTEQTHLINLQRNIATLHTKIQHTETKRNANRTMQDGQERKLRQTIETKQIEANHLESLLTQSNDDSLRADLNSTMEELDNLSKCHEDLEFQCLEEEAEWSAHHEDLLNDLRTLRKMAEDKQQHITVLQAQCVDTQAASACNERDMQTQLCALKELQEQLRRLDAKWLELTGNPAETAGDSDEDDDDLIISENQRYRNKQLQQMSRSLFGSQEILQPAKVLVPCNDLMSRSVNENMFLQNNNIETRAPATSTPIRNSQQGNAIYRSVDISEDITKVAQFGHEHLRRAEQQRDSTDDVTALKYNLSPPFQHRADEASESPDSEGTTARQRNAHLLNLSIESDDFEVNPLERRVPSQDDIDRICKITLDAPISTQGASDKVIESIREIERNRQLLLKQQGSHVIEHERQKMHELKKKSHDEARAQYMQQLHNAGQGSGCDSGDDRNSYANKDRSLEGVESSGSPGTNAEPLFVERPQPQPEKQLVVEEQHQPRMRNSSGSTSNAVNNNQSPKRESDTSPHRYSQPDFERSRSIVDGGTGDVHAHDKPFKSSTDIRLSSASPSSAANNNGNYAQPLVNNYQPHYELQQQPQRQSQASHESIGSNSIDTPQSSNDAGIVPPQPQQTNTLVSGSRRNLPKHQRPLTRYLPIMSHELNLRQHIESAGHQVALCPHVLLDASSCRGYLHKLGATFHGWSRRWFLFDRQKMALIYFSDKSERKPRGGAYFSTIDEVYLDHMNTSKSGRPYCTFIVKTKKRSYHLQAASDAAARIWIDAIITGAQGNIDY